jgi:hypothetical protein
VSAPAALAQVYCTNEDIARRAPQDFFNLCPKFQYRAKGTDGVFLTASPWLLTSASVSFAGNGVGSNDVAALVKPGVFSTPSELFAVDSASGGSITLRRIGEQSGVGQAPGPAAGVTGVTFEVRTFATQIENASYDCNKFFGVDPNIPCKSPTLLYDARELTMFCVLTVLRRAYIDGVKVKTDDYEMKLALVSQELDDLRSRLAVQWGTQADGNPPNSVMTTRCRR